MPTKKVKHPKMDRKLIAYKQPYEVKDICRLWKKETDDKKHVNIRASELRALVAKLPHKHSLKEVEACLIGAGYIKYPRKKKK